MNTASSEAARASRAEATLSPLPLERFSLDGFLASSARLWRDRLAMRDTCSSPLAGFTCSELDAEVGRMAGVLAHLGLLAGERILVCGGIGLSVIVACLAALRAGLDVGLALPAFTTEEIADAARRIRAAAILGNATPPTTVAAETLLAAAAQAPCVRLLCTSGGMIDGAAALDAAAWAHEELAVLAPNPSAGAVITFTNGAGGIEPVFHRQATLIAAALDVARRAKIGANSTVLSTIAPVTFAGLVAGPIGALLSGAPLHLHTSFAAAAFLDALDDSAPAHLVVPANIACDLAGAGLATPAYLASLLLLRRIRSEQSSLPGQPLDGVVPILDLYALGERAAVAEQRRQGAGLAPLAREPHLVSVDATRILAFEMREASGKLEIRGAGVTDGEDWSVP
ncbi:MAG: AMP-binding protein [Methylobacteriaceae bacterium]|nr:AMP-binding protein [Methylobacteriaceae bacterium]